MQRPMRSYRGGFHVGSHMTRNNCDKKDEDNDRSSVSNSNKDEIEDNSNYDNDTTIKSKTSTILSSIAIDADFESIIRNLRPLAIHEKKIKNKPNMYSQKADLPQMDMLNDSTNNINEEIKNKNSHPWFPKPDVGHIKSNDFICHNHIVSQQTPPTLLTTMPPADISTRPTAIVGQANSTRSISTDFSSSSSFMEKLNSKTIDDYQQSTISASLKQTSSSAFRRIHSIQNATSNTANQSNLVDIPKHKPLERGQKLAKVHISHAQSPSIVHLMLHEDFHTACRLLHSMSVHSELQSDYVSDQTFKPEVNQICACFHEGRWFRCRVTQISSDLSTATVIYLDWGMVIPLHIESKYIRRLPNEFYAESACSIQCHLDGVSDSNESIPSSIIAQCIRLLSENEYDVLVTDYHQTTGGQIILSCNGQIINDKIQRLISPYMSMSLEDELIEQFRHELQLSVGDELKALLSSFSGNDDAFYVLIINDNTNAIDRAMSELQEDHIPNREFFQIPQIKTLVVARYTDDQKCYRAWVKSVDIEHEQAVVFFVDFGNESKVSFSDIFICPESVRKLPWLGIRVRLTNESMTTEELTTFWKLTEANYIYIRINEIFKDSYGIQIKIDYTTYLQQERLKMATSKRFLNKCLQTTSDEKSIYPRHSLERNSCLSTPLKVDPHQIGNENMIHNLFDIINNDLRLLRQRINGSEEASQDRHSQLVQLLFSTINTNSNTNSNS